MIESWRPIPGYEGRYEVSDCARVRSLITNKLLKIRPAKERGYLIVAICKAGERNNSIMVHRLVAMAFLPNPDNLPQVNHIDKNRLNNHVSNLEWISNLDNHRHSAEAFLAVNNEKRYHKLSPADVAVIRDVLAKGEATQAALAKRYGVHPTTIWNIKNNRARTTDSPDALLPRTFSKNKRHLERDRAIYAMSLEGHSHKAISKVYGICRSYVSLVIRDQHEMARQEAHAGCFKAYRAMEE